MHHCNQEQLESIIVMLDMEKAYDRVSWKYLHECIKQAGFGINFRKWVTTLYPIDPNKYPEHYTELGITLAHTHAVNILPLERHCNSSLGS